MLSPEAPAGKDRKTTGGQVPVTGSAGRTADTISSTLGQHGSHGTVPRRWLAAVRLAWVLLAATLVALFVSRFPMRSALALVIAPAYVPGLARLGLSTADFRAIVSLLDVLTMISFSVVGLVIFWRKSDEWTALVTSLALIAVGAMPTFLRYGVRVPGMWNWQDATLLATGTALSVATVCIFPDGRFFPRWTIGLTAFICLWTTAWLLWPGLNPYYWPYERGASALSVVYVMAGAAFIYRYHHTGSLGQRQQIKWALYAFSLQIPLWLLAVFPAFALRGLLTLPQYSLALLLGGLFIVLVQFAIPLSLAVAILRYRLWDIDLIINRTLVYVPLTGILAGVYAASIAMLQRLFLAFTGQTSDTAVVITTLLIVAVFAPLKDWLQHAADRRYRDRHDPLAPVEAFGRRVRSVVDVFDARRITRQMLETTAANLGCSAGAVYLDQGGRTYLVHSYGNWRAGEAALEIPLEAYGTHLGCLQLAPRRDGTVYSPRDCRIIRQAVDEVASAIYLTQGRPLSVDSLGE
jgi:hypothetical protein